VITAVDGTALPVTHYLMRDALTWFDMMAFGAETRLMPTDVTARL